MADLTLDDEINLRIVRAKLQGLATAREIDKWVSAARLEGPYAYRGGDPKRGPMTSAEWLRLWDGTLDRLGKLHDKPKP